MGIAAYNRGTRAIRAQIDAEMAAKSSEMDARAASMRDHNERVALKARVSELEAELKRAKDCIARLRIYRDVDAESAKAREDKAARNAELYKNMLLSSFRSNEALRKRVAWMRGLLVFCGVTREDVDRYENS